MTQKANFRGRLAKIGHYRPCFNTLLKREAHKRLFRELGVNLANTDGLISMAEEYVCALYGLKKIREVNAARFELFKHRLHSSGVIDLSVIPPCQSVLLLHLHRAALTAFYWKNAKTAVIPELEMSNTDGLLMEL